MVFAADVYVELTGVCGGKTPCYSTIQEAINAANSGDTIKLSQGIYAETFVLNSGKQLKTQGGWDAGFTEQTPRTTSIRAPKVPNGAMSFQELRVMEIAGPLGNATIADVLSGKTFSSDDGEGLTGTMPIQTLSNATTAVSAGYYSDANLTTIDADLTAENIKAGKVIFGVSGDPNVVDTSSGNAIPGDLLSGKKASVQGELITGSVASGDNIIGDNGQLKVDIPDGIYSGSKTVTVNDADLDANNIKNGTTIFGVDGTFPSDGTATVGEVKTGSTFYTTSGTKLTGTMSDSTVDIVPGTTEQTIPEGYHDGTGRVWTDTDLKAENIRAGVTIFGVEGTLDREYCIGGPGPSGGIVFYITDGGTTGPHGLELATSQIGPVLWESAVATAESYSTLFASTGWYLPSADEAIYICHIKEYLDDMVIWTSTPWPTNPTLYQQVFTIRQDTPEACDADYIGHNELETHYVRPIHLF